MPSPQQRDMQWTQNPLWGAEPAWSTQPSLAHLETIARRHLDVPPHVSCTISLFAQGAFNKLYTIDTPGKAHLLRVALPVEPRLKTLSEVATIDFVRAHATELVPRVPAYEAEARSDGLGFEWMIMERLPGGPLADHWTTMTWESKVALVKTVVGILAKLFDCPLSGIGNMYPGAPVPGRIVSMSFFWDTRFEQDVPRGPFRSSHDWLHARLQLAHNEAATRLARPAIADDSYDEADREDAAKTHAFAERLFKLLPRIFPPSTDAALETTIVHHDDLARHNLLTFPAGELAGIVDWECVSALPLWRACTIPGFLEDTERTEEPVEAKYSRDADDASKANELFYEHVLEWELTRLRDVFLEEMEHVKPEWMRVHRTSVLKVDFDAAVLHCNTSVWLHRVRAWLDQVEAMSDEALASGEVGEGYVSF